MVAPETRFGSLLRRIHEAYPNLPDRERRVADTILNTPAEMPVWSASELAGLSGVSNATVSRLIQRLGYPGFEAARQDARALRDTGTPLFDKDTTSYARSRHSSVLRDEMRMIEETLERLDIDSLRQAATAIAAARQVRLAGFRNSRFLADYLAAQFTQFRADVAPLFLEGQTMAEAVAGLGEGDLVVVVGLRRRPAKFTQIVRMLSERNVRVLLIADQGLREAPAYATWTLTCSVETAQPLDSYVGAMALLRLLTTEMAVVLGEDGRHHLNTVESLRETLEELEPVR